MEILDFPYWRARGGLGPVCCAVLLLALGPLVGCGTTRQAPRLSARAPLAARTGPATSLVDVARPAPDRQAPAAPHPDAAGLDQAGPGVLHEVRSGQTLWRIARTYGVPLDELAQANGIGDAAHIEAGSVIFVPGAQAVREIVLPAAAPAPGDGEWVWPVPDGRILAHFGDRRRTHLHMGIDIDGHGGQRVLAARAGNVVYSADGMRGYGRTVILDHGGGLLTLYAHNASLAVHQGQRVRTGQLIARVGRTGNATTEHCHFEIRRNEVPVDPLLYLTPEIGTAR